MYSEQKFALPALDGISQRQLDVHLKLYGGYVKFLNTLLEVEKDLMKDPEKNAYALGEVHRRLPFEFDGMRMHEYYFAQWEDKANTDAPKLQKALADQHGSFESFVSSFKSIGMTRGIGWTISYFDPKVAKFHTAWVGDHELGQLAGLPIILALDMWEHAYMVDYTPAEKKNYIEAFFKNLNWSVPEARFLVAQ